MNEEHLRRVTLGELKPLAQPIELHEYDPAWPRLFEVEKNKIRAALGDGALAVEHVGSTSVPGLAAKPILDILLSVADSSNEAAYVPNIEATGYRLRIREPEWHQHRMFRGPGDAVNLHVFSRGCPEIERMLLFRDWLRQHPEDRNLYETTKHSLAKQSWKYTQNYADAKSAVVEQILARARSL